MSKISPKWLLISLFIGWIFFSTTIFYTVQKPITAESIISLIQSDKPNFIFSWTALARTLLNLGVGLWLWGLSLGIGAWAYRNIIPVKHIELTSWLEGILFSLGLGLGLLGLLVFGLGLLRLLQSLTLYIITITLTVLTLPYSLRLLRQVDESQEQRGKSPPKPSKGGLGRYLFIIYAILNLGLSLTLTLLPPTDWDGLFYHLTGPKHYLAAGHIVSGLDIPHLSFPSLFEMLYLLAMALRNDITAKLLHFGFILLLAGLVYIITKRWLGLKQDWSALAFLFAMPMLFTLGSWAYNDLVLAFYQVAALYALLKGLEASWRTNRQWLLLSGLFCGLAMSLKYTSFITPMTLGSLLWWSLWRRKASWAIFWRASLSFGLSATLVALPWYLKNWAFTGNPVYPFIFGGTFWDDFRSVAYSGAGTGIGFDPIALLTLPYTLTLGIQDANYLDGRMGPLFLAYLPLILLYGLFRYRRSTTPSGDKIVPLLIFTAAQVAFWTLGVMWSDRLWQSRLLLTALVVLCPVLAWILADLVHLNHPQFSLQSFLMLFLACVLTLNMTDHLFNNQIQSWSGWVYHQPWHYLLGSETREAYLTRRIGLHYTAMTRLNQDLPAEATVVFLWEPRSYYCDLDCRPDSILDRYGHLQYLYGPNPEAITDAWLADGVTHVLVFQSGLNFLGEEDNVPAALRPDITLLAQLKQEHFELLIDLPAGYQIYRLKNN